MDRMRDVNWTVRLFAVIGMILFGGVLLGAQPALAVPVDIPMPNRIDTGGGSANPAPWLFWVVPGLAVLTLVAGVAGWWMARSEQDKP